MSDKQKYGDHVFVYQTTISTEFICKILKKMNEKFIIYGFNKDQVDGNLVFKRFNEDEFYHDISNAKAIITNGGFTVISEALYLKKPIFSLPIKNQFEQILNGKFIQKLGVGVYYMTLSLPKSRLKSRAKDIDKNLPYAINYMAAMSSANVSPTVIFRGLSRQDIYGEIKNEA